MCLPKMSSPKLETPSPAPTYESAKTDDVVRTRAEERKRMRRAVNTRTTILSGQEGSERKTLLGI